jgi:hypothetical protein
MHRRSAELAARMHDLTPKRHHIRPPALQAMEPKTQQIILCAPPETSITGSPINCKKLRHHFYWSVSRLIAVAGI